ncbi:hypothetical protein BH23ACT10_BH23ACT10_16360 [soil metagenome]
MSGLLTGVTRQRWRPVVAAVVATCLLVAALALGADRVGGVSRLLLEDTDALWWTCAVVGMLVLRRRPANVVGWVLLVGGVTSTAVGFLFEYANLALLRDPTLPGGAIATWGGVSLVWLYLATIPFVFQLFPDGRLRGRIWAALWWATVATIAVTVASTAVAAWPVRGWALLELDEAGATVSPTAELASSVLFVLIIASTLVPVVRYRRATAVVRQQIKWLMLAGVWLFAVIVSAELITGVVGTLLDGLSLMPIPVAIGVAVGRYRLYEVDRLISRSPSYGVVTAVMVGCYVAVAVVPSAVFELKSDLLVAAATLVAAAAFLPLRARVQALVDRRFDRARYDAQRVVERFGTRLRDELDAEALAGDPHHTVIATVQPTHASVWLVGETAR